jgi:hypothetical protein
MLKRRNPVPPSSKSLTTLIEKGKSLYTRFSGHDAEIVGKIEVPKFEGVGVAIGEVDGILYTTVRDGKTEKYIHKFHAKSRPLLIVSPDGKQLGLVGGLFTFTERGIVDEDVHGRPVE